jgi:hypothetical protein
MKVIISRKEVEAFAGYYWNQLNEFLALSETEELSGKLLDMHHFYWVGSEVSSGGFLQYFENKCDWNQDGVSESILRLGAIEHHRLFDMLKSLNNELRGYYENEESHLEAIDRLEDESVKIEFAFNQLIDPLVFLEEYLREHEDELVEWVA